MKNNKNVKSFIESLKRRCLENNIELRFVDSYSVRQDGVSVGGSFGGVRKTVLTSCTDRPDWLHILVHESCHMDQYLYDQKIWTNKGDSYDQVDDWLHGKKIRNIHTHINNIQDLELDCEKRAVMKIKNFDLPIDIEEYTKRANAYVYFFSYLKLSRHWPNSKNSAYVKKEIWQHMPTVWQKSYRKLSKKYLQLFKEHI